MKHFRVSKGLAERAQDSLLPENFDADLVESFFSQSPNNAADKGNAMAALLAANEKSSIDLMNVAAPLQVDPLLPEDTDSAYAKGAKGGGKPTSTDGSTSDKGFGKGGKNKTDPGTTDPGTTDPGTTDPGTSDSGSTDTGGTDTGGTGTGAGGTDTGGTGTGGTETNPGSTDPNVYVSGLDTPDGFNIEVEFSGNWTDEMKTILVGVVEEISDTITGDIPSYNGIDDFSLLAVVNEIDGGGGYLGVGGTLIERPDSHLPSEGYFRFDQADVATQLSRGTFGDVVYHEVMHALGFGTIWSELGLVQSVNGENRFIGQNAIEAYNKLFPTIAANDPDSLQGVPISGDQAHWDHGTFTSEIMTTSLLFSGNYVSDMTIAALEDMGYSTVLDLSAYDSVA